MIGRHSHSNQKWRPSQDLVELCCGFFILRALSLRVALQGLGKALRRRCHGWWWDTRNHSSQFGLLHQRIFSGSLWITFLVLHNWNGQWSTCYIVWFWAFPILKTCSAWCSWDFYSVASMLVILAFSRNWWWSHFSEYQGWCGGSAGGIVESVIGGADKWPSTMNLIGEWQGHHHHHHHHPWPSLTTSPYRSLPLAGLQGYTYPHIAAVCMFLLVILLLLGHMWGSIVVHHLWARPCFSSSVLHVRFV